MVNQVLIRCRGCVVKIQYLFSENLLLPQSKYNSVRKNDYENMFGKVPTFFSSFLIFLIFLIFYLVDTFSIRYRRGGARSINSYDDTTVVITYSLTI